MSDKKKPLKKEQRNQLENASSGYLSQGRNVPYNLDAEQALLACCIIGDGNDGLDKCMQEHITADTFYFPAHREIFQALLEMSSANQAIDLVTIGDRLRARGSFEGIGGAIYLNEICDRIETPGFIDDYIRIVTDNSIMRYVMKVSQEAIEEIGAGMRDVQHFLSGFEERVFKIGDKGIKDQAHAMPEMMSSATEQVQKLLTNKGRILGVTSGFHGLDARTGGFKANQMIVVAARPGMGKTSLALNMIEAAVLPLAGKSRPVPTLLFSLEMGADELSLRLLCSRAGVSSIRLAEGTVTRQQEQDLAKTARELASVPLFVDDTAGLTILELRAKARRLKKKHDIGMIVVDYLQLLNGTESKVSRQEQIAEISRGMKGMAKELGVPVIALAQLNRESERERREPRMSDLRESGAIEQDADLILFISKKDKDDMIEGMDPLLEPRDLIIAKQRSGPTGKVVLLFKKSITRFLEASDR